VLGPHAVTADFWALNGRERQTLKALPAPQRAEDAVLKLAVS
jgi:hypothetical protein